MKKDLAAAPEDLTIEFYLPRHSLYRLLDERWKTGSTLMRNEGARIVVEENGANVRIVPATEHWDADALLTDQSTCTSLLSRTLQY